MIASVCCHRRRLWPGSRYLHGRTMRAQSLDQVGGHCLYRANAG
jgi:hypothetical protein